MTKLVHHLCLGLLGTITLIAMFGSDSDSSSAILILSGVALNVLTGVTYDA